MNLELNADELMVVVLSFGLFVREVESAVNAGEMVVTDEHKEVLESLDEKLANLLDELEAAYEGEEDAS